MSDRRVLILVKPIFVLLIIGITQMAAGVSIIPNTSEVHAIVKQRSIVDGEKTARLTLYVLSANDYNGMPNFMKENVGKNVTVVVSGDIIHCFEHDEVNILVSVVGDERGQFYIAKPKPTECR